MKELYEFKNMCNQLQESEIEAPNDYGAHRNLDEPDYVTGRTFLEQGMEGIYADIAAHGKSESESKRLVDKAIKELVDQSALPEPPVEEDADGKKAQWIHMARPKVVANLRLSGVIM